MAGTITFDGLATGINTTELVDKLVVVESRPKILKEAEKVRLENQLSTWQEINSKLLSVQIAANDLSRLATWNTQTVRSGNEDVLTATAALGAPQGTYTVQVEALARNHQLATRANPAGGDAGYASEGALFGTGELKLTVGGVEHTLTLDATNNTLGGVAQAINGAKLGVTASVIYNGSGYQLLLASNKTGVENALSVDALGLDTTGTRSLDAWATVQEAADAQVSLGSGAGKITVSSASNTVSSLLQGITLNLKSAAPGTDVTVTVARSAESLTEKMQAFADAYNEAASYISQQFAYNPDKNVAGILMGDATLLGVQRALGQMLTHAVASGSAYGVLSSVGLTAGDGGTVSFNAARFAQAVEDDFEGVMRLFRSGGTSSHTQVSYTFSSGATKAGTYVVDVTAPATRALLIGTGAPSLTVTGANDELTLRIDGGAQVTVKLAQKTYASAQELAEELQGQINRLSSAKVSVSVDASGALGIQSERYGSGSRIAIVGGSAVTNTGSDGKLGFAVATASGTDVQGTINGEPATGTGQVLRGKAGNPNTEGLQVLAQLDAPGTATLTVTKGVFSRFDEYLSSLTDPISGALGRREESVNTSIRNLTLRIAEMEERLETRRLSLTAQFIRMEKAVSQFNSQGNYLTNALSGLSKSWSWNS